MKRIIFIALSLLTCSGAYAQETVIDEVRETLDGNTAQHKSGSIAYNWSRSATIALAPFQYTENGVGFGLSYEHPLDWDGYISAYVPFIASYNINKNTSSAMLASSTRKYHSNQPYKDNLMYYAMPGMKFYPTGMGKVKYAVGPSAVIGVGRKEVIDRRFFFVGTGGNESYSTYTPARFLFGTMINNSLNINATRHLYVGAEMGLGFTFIDKIDNINQGVTFLTQGSFKMGYRF